jgi:hypothetical protein
MSILVDALINIINDEFEKIIDDIPNDGYMTLGYKDIIQNKYESFNEQLEFDIQKEFEVYHQEMRKYVKDKGNIVFDNLGNIDFNYNIKDKILNKIRTIIENIIDNNRFIKLNNKLNNNVQFNKYIQLNNINFTNEIETIILIHSPINDDLNIDFDISFHQDGSLNYLKVNNRFFNKDNWVSNC